MEMIIFLVICGVIVAFYGIDHYRKKKNSTSNRSESPPPLPARRRDTNTIRPPDRNSHNERAVVEPPSLPTRRTATPRQSGTTREILVPSLGPRGIQPTQFPCCPFDKQRNLPGEEQLIFWNGRVNHYECSRGHKFKSNGKPF